MVFKSVESVNESLIAEEKIPHDSSVQIYGSNSHIDSFSFVQLIVGIEEIFFDIEGLEINLLDSVADVGDNFRSISDLVGLIQSLVNSQFNR